MIRELAGPADAGVIHRVNWDLRYPVPPGTGRGGGGEGEEGGGGRFGPGNEKPGAVALPVPSHDIGPRGPHVAPGTFKVTLDVDGVTAESRTFEVRADPASTITLTQHKAREAFTVEVMALQTKVEAMAVDLRKRRETLGTETGAELTRLQALEQRLVGGGGRGGAGGGRGAARASRVAPSRVEGRQVGASGGAAGASAAQRPHHRVCRFRRADRLALGTDRDDADHTGGGEDRSGGDRERNRSAVTRSLTP